MAYSGVFLGLIPSSSRGSSPPVCPSRAGGLFVHRRPGSASVSSPLGRLEEHWLWERLLPRTRSSGTWMVLSVRLVSISVTWVWAPRSHLWISRMSGAESKGNRPLQCHLHPAGEAETSPLEAWGGRKYGRKGFLTPEPAVPRSSPHCEGRPISISPPASSRTALLRWLWSLLAHSHAAISVFRGSVAGHALVQH